MIGDIDAERDDAEMSGIGDQDGLIEQTVGEPSPGATLDLDQRVAWHAGRGVLTTDGEMTGTVEDIETRKTVEAFKADQQARAETFDRVRDLVARRRTAPIRSGRIAR